MQQESQPLLALQTRQRALESRANTFTTFVSKASALQSAAEALADIDSASSYKATSNDPTAVAISAGSSAVSGRYEVTVTELARAQVMVSSSSSADSDTTVVANAGTLTIGGHAITISGSVTLKGL